MANRFDSIPTRLTFSRTLFARSTGSSDFTANLNCTTFLPLYAYVVVFFWYYIMRTTRRCRATARCRINHT